MFTEIAIKKLIDFLLSLLKKNLPKQLFIHEVVRNFNYKILENTFDSIYINSVIEYSYITTDLQLLKLFLNEEVKNSLNSGISENSVGEFHRIITHVFRSHGYYELKSKYLEDEIIQEAVKFKSIFSKISKQLQTPFYLEMYNEQIEKLDELIKYSRESSYV